ncbi:hypothetical protein BDV40DRAFT_283490 [Aspergillus tamarii]|uniref:Uncharacterized protein n=1 Tax=Aspergillus tamarii TaxID=41984 RepID=A0A5N6UAB7_ASPTM|nr:hypothetical protein BDV40DRAFT_283490 [Aspergillus tamarii]
MTRVMVPTSLAHPNPTTAPQEDQTSYLLTQTAVQPLKKHPSVNGFFPIISSLDSFMIISRDRNCGITSSGTEPLDESTTQSQMDVNLSRRPTEAPLLDQIMKRIAKEKQPLLTFLNGDRLEDVFADYPLDNSGLGIPAAVQGTVNDFDTSSAYTFKRGNFLPSIRSAAPQRRIGNFGMMFPIQDINNTEG